MFFDVVFKCFVVILMVFLDGFMVKLRAVLRGFLGFSDSCT